MSSRSYKPSIDDEELDGRFVRGQEVSRYVAQGFFDCGLCGQDWILENESDVIEVCDLVYSRASNQKARWVLCVPEASPIRRPADLAGKRIATELVGTVRRYFAAQGGVLVASDDTRLHDRFVVRSRFLRFPDTVDVEIVPSDAEHATLAVYSRSQLGGFDFGTNLRRVRALLEALGPGVASASLEHRRI